MELMLVWPREGSSVPDNPTCVSSLLALQYFQARLNTTYINNGTVVERKEYYFNNWMTLLSQLPLLLFTLLNSFFYQRSGADQRRGQIKVKGGWRPHCLNQAKHR